MTPFKHVHLFVKKRRKKKRKEKIGIEKTEISPVFKSVLYIYF